MSKPALRALLAVLLVAACGGPTVSALPAPTQVTQSPTSSAAPGTPTATEAQPSSDDVSAIEALVEAMAAAVLARDRTGYLELVDLSDPVFALEHGRWADEWSGPKPVAQYALGVGDLAIDGDGATARLTVQWMLPGGDGPRTATFDARFTRGSGGWRYAGERWIARDTPQFRVLVAPGLESDAAAIVAALPEVNQRVTTAAGYVPGGTMQIKEYLDAEALVANTLLSLPPIRGWNEPGEALKLRAEPEDPSHRLVIAHEFTHFLMFDRAGTQRTRMPWWLDEGIATFVASAYDAGDTPDRLEQVVAWAAAGELAPWRDMAVFEDTPLELWQFAYPQGYAMVRYVTERFGETDRNAWLAAMATDMDIDQATPAVLGTSFDALDVAFRDWLSAH
jgi:hypothetical protein